MKATFCNYVIDAYILSSDGYGQWQDSDVGLQGHED